MFPAENPQGLFYIVGMSRAAKRRRKMMMESQPLPLPPPKTKHNLAFRKKTLIILFGLEVCFIITFFVLKAKTNSFHLGYIIDDAFLDKLVEREQYKTLLRISIAFFISFGFGIILHIFKVLPPRKDNKEPNLNKFIIEFLILVLLAIGISLPQVIELPA